MLESLFKKIIKKKLQRRCLPVNTTNSSRTAFLQNTSGGCFWVYFLHAVAVAWRCSVKKVFLEILQNSRENTKKKKMRLWHIGFPLNFIKFIRTLFLTDFLQWLLLCMIVIPQSLPILSHPLATVNRVPLLPFSSRKHYKMNTQNIHLLHTSLLPILLL